MIITIGLALWALCYILVYEDGPWDIVDKFRKWAGVEIHTRYGGRNKLDAEYRNSDKFIGKLLNCPVCLSVWLSVPVVLVGLLLIELLYPLAAIGMVIMFSGVFGGDN